MQRIFHTPEGVRDIYNGECSQKRKVQEKIHRVFHQYGYEDIETPTFEYFEVFSRVFSLFPGTKTLHTCSVAHNYFKNNVLAATTLLF